MVTCERCSHEYLYWEFHERGGRRAIRQGDWKLVMYDVKTDSPRQAELYNLISDQSENENLADAFPEKVDQLLSLMQNRSESPMDIWNFEEQ